MHAVSVAVCYQLITDH